MSITVLGLAMAGMMWSVGKMLASERQLRVVQLEIDHLQRRAAERQAQLAVTDAHR